MKTKILIALFATGLIVSSTMKAQEKEPMNEKNDQMDKVIYTCSMHPEVVSENSGECSKCSMVLVKKKMSPKTSSTKVRRVKTVKTYVCSMHPDQVSGKTGKCPVCGMKLIEEKVDTDKKVTKRRYQHT